MRLRSFNAAGINAFQKFLQTARQEPATNVPFHLLDDDSLTDLVEPAIEVHPQRFRLRADAAHYFRDLLEPLNEHRVANDAGLWTWLTMFYFDEVCPKLAGKERLLLRF